MEIPDYLFQKYEEGTDLMIAKFGVNCKIVYPSEKEECENCIINTLYGGSLSVYKTGGPIPFVHGVCPHCDGVGFKEKEISEIIRMRVYFDRKIVQQFVNQIVKTPGIAVDNSYAMCIGYISDMPKLQNGRSIYFNIENQGYDSYKYELAGDPKPHGFRRSRYFISVWKRA